MRLLDCMPRALALWMAAALAASAGLPLVTGDPELDDAQAETARLAERGQWAEVIPSAERLLIMRRSELGADHPDLALAEIFLGQARLQLGSPTLAEVHFRRALALQEKTLGPLDPEIPVTLTHLAAALKALRRYEEAAPLLQRAVALQIQIAGEEDEDVAVSYRNLGWLSRAKGDLQGSAAFFQKALAIRQRVQGDRAPETLLSLREMAEVWELLGDLPAAERCAGERVRGLEGNEADPALAAALAEWGAIAARQGHDADAEPRFRRALALREAVLPPDDPLLALSATDLGNCLKNLGRLPEAAGCLEMALGWREELLSMGAADTAASQRNLGWVYRLQQDYARAPPLFEAALKTREATGGPAGTETLESLAELSELLWLRGDYGSATAQLETRRQRMEKRYGAKSAEAAAASESLAILAEASQHWPEAMAAARQALVLSEGVFGASSAATLNRLYAFARICAAAGDFASAREQYRRLENWFVQHPEADRKLHAQLLRAQAIATLQAGHQAEAEPLFHRSRQAHEAGFGPRDPATLRSLGDLWTYYDQCGQSGRALEAARELAERSRQQYGDSAEATLAVEDRLGQLCLTVSDAAEAARWFRRSLEGRAAHFGADAPEVLEALGQFAQWLEHAGAFAAAVELRAQRLAAVEKKFGMQDIRTAAACGELGEARFGARDFAGAGDAFYRQLALEEPRLGSGNPVVLAIMKRIAEAASAGGDWRRACEWRERLVAEWDKQPGPTALDRAQARLAWGEALLSGGLAPRASEVLREAVRVAQQGGAAGAVLLARAACAQGLAALRTSDRGAAEEGLRLALEAAPATAADETMVQAFASFGRALADAGHSVQAEAALEKALALLDRQPQDASEMSVTVLSRLAILRWRNGDASAEALIERALTASEAVNGSTHRATVELLGWAAVARAHAGRLKNAQAAADRLCDREANIDSPQAVIAQGFLGWIAFQSSGLESARGPWRAGLRGMGENWPWLAPVAALGTSALEKFWSVLGHSVNERPSASIQAPLR